MAPRCAGGLVLTWHVLVAFAEQRFDLQLAQRYASVSSAVYCDELDQLENWTCFNCQQSGMKLVPGKIKVIDASFFNSARILVGKVQDEESCLIAFRGTDNWENWFRDAGYWRSKYEHCKDCMVHGGFLTVWTDVQPKLLDALSEIGCPHSNTSGGSYSLYITGHSLGASLGQLAMFTLHELKYKVVSSYFFEAPRLGNKAFKDAFSSLFKDIPVFRSSHFKDPVIHLPPKWVGFVHSVDEVYFGENGTNYTLCGDEDPRCADQFSSAWDLLMHAGDHCSSPLVPNGNICWPTSCLNEKTKMELKAKMNRKNIVLV